MSGRPGRPGRERPDPREGRDELEHAVRVSRRGQLVGIAFLVVAVLVGVVVSTGAFGGGDPAKNASVVDGIRGTRETTALLRGIPQQGIVLGRADAPATIVEFVDLKCPYCRNFELGDGQKVIRNLVRTGKANIELRVLGLDQFRPDTLIGRTAVHALAADGRAWDLAELVYYNQGEEAERWVTPARLTAIAAQSPELRGRALTTTPTPDTRRLDTAADDLARRLDVKSTPTFFVRPRGRTDDGAYAKIDTRGIGSTPDRIADAVAKASAAR